MAEKYIINMPLKTTPDDTDLMIIEDAQDTKRMTWANIVKPIKDMIGNLASLTTNHKTSVVGAINEIDNTVAAHLADVATKTTTLSTSLSTTVNRISRSGNLVTIGFYSTGAITGAEAIATVPVGYRPSATANLLASFKQGDILINYMISVGADGNIVQQYTGGELREINIFGTYII